MSDKAFVDTNIFLYALDVKAGDKHERARSLIEELWEMGRGVLSTQVLQELSINLGRKTGQSFSAEDRRNVLKYYSKWETVTNTAQSILRALDFEERYKVSFWDALILQAAEQAGASILYSEDLAHDRMYGPVRVVNPLL